MYKIEIYQINLLTSPNGFIPKEEIITFKDLSFFSQLNGIGGAMFKMNTNDPKTTTDNFYRYRNQIIIKDNDTIVFFGPITSVTGGYKDTGGYVQIQAKGYLQHLLARFTASERSFTATDAGAIATGLITDTQALTNGNLFISSGTIQTTTNRDRTYYYKAVGEAIQDLTTVIGGFDFNFTPTQDSSGRFTGALFNVYTALGAIRTDLPILKLGENVSSVSFATQNDITNYVTARGSGSGTGTLTATSESTSSEQSYTRREDVLKFDDILVLGTLQQKADEYLTMYQSETYDINITLMPGKAPVFGQFILGDTLPLSLIVPGTMINFDGYGVVKEIRVDVDDQGVGTVTPKIQYIK